MFDYMWNLSEQGAIGLDDLIDFSEELQECARVFVANNNLCIVN